MNEFGGFFKQYYLKVTNKSFDSTKVHAKSTFFNRTLDSSRAFLNGLFGSDNKIVINTAPLDRDKVLHGGATCPRYNLLKLNMRNSSKYLKLQKDNKACFG